MISEELGAQLHDRHTRGQILSAEEMKQLQTWYAQNDEEEDLAQGNPPAEQTKPTSQAQVDLALRQIEIVTRQIRKLERQNEALRSSSS